MKQNKPGYILILTLMAIALITTIITKMYYQSSAYLPLADLVVKRQKAANLALGGLQMALSKLNGPQNQEESDSKNKKNKSKEALLLERILPSLNRWQAFNLKEDVDGVNGQIKICVSCENGKVNLNQLYDFAKHELKDAKIKQLMQEIFAALGKLTKNQIDSKLANEALMKFLSERKYQLLDATELLQIPEFSYFKQHVFYHPPQDAEQTSENLPRPVYLTDIFTTWTSSPQVEPWLFSDSVLALLSFPRAQANDIMKRDGKVKEWTKNLKESSNWQTDWDKSLGLVYGNELANLPKSVVSLFETKFNPQVFSAISCGTIEGITQTVYAIIKLQSENTGSSFFVIEKLYWI
jgi:hypothetical protein